MMRFIKFWDWRSRDLSVIYLLLAMSCIIYKWSTDEKIYLIWFMFFIIMSALSQILSILKGENG